MLIYNISMKIPESYYNILLDRTKLA